MHHLLFCIDEAGFYGDVTDYSMMLQIQETNVVQRWLDFNLQPALQKNVREEIVMNNFRRAAIVMVLVLLVSMAACKPGGSDPGTQSSEPKQTLPTVLEPTSIPTTTPTTLPTQPNEEGALSAAMRAELEAFFGEWEQLDPVGPNIVSGRYYYGTYNGYVVLMFGGNLDAMSQIVIGEHIFNWGTTPFKMLAYKDGKIQDLKAVYEAGLITATQLTEIHEKHVTHDEAHPMCDCYGQAS